MKSLIVLAAVAAAAPATAATLTPVSVTATDTFDLFGQYKVGNLVDGSGLTSGLHNGDFTAMWMTNLGVNQASLTFTFDRVYALQSASIWNYNFGNPAEFQSTILRGVKDFRLLASTDGTSYTLITEARLAMGTGQPLAAQTFDATGFSARFVRLEILNNYGQGTYAERDWNSGLSEVRFAGAAVPEPASWALMIAGFGLAGSALRRRTTGVSFA